MHRCAEMRMAYSTPRREVPRGVMVGMGMLATPKAGALCWTAPIPFLDKATVRARAAGVARITHHQRHASAKRFIGDKSPQWGKAPSGMPVALACANRQPAAHVRQLFQHQGSFRVFGLRNKSWGNTVVHTTTKPRCCPGHLRESPLGRFRAGGLVRVPGCPAPAPDTFDIGPCVAVAVRVRCQLHNTKVHPKTMRGLHRRLFWGVNGHEQEELSVHQHQVRLPRGSGKPHPLVLAHLHRNDNASAQRHKARERKPLKRQDAFIVHDGPIRTKSDLVRFIPLVGFDRFGNRTNGELCRQPKPLTYLLVQRFLQDKLRGAAFSIGVCGNPRTRGVKGVHGLQQERVLRARREKFHLQRCFHIEK